MALAAGDFFWLAVAEMRYAEGFEDGITLFSAVALGQVCEAVLDVFSYGEVRKQSEILKNVADFAMLHRNVRSPLVVEQNSVCDGNLS